MRLLGEKDGSIVDKWTESVIFAVGLRYPTKTEEPNRNP